MKFILRKCKVGDKVVLRDGRTAEVIEVGKVDDFPIAHDGGTCKGNDGYHACSIFGKSCIDDDNSDIVGIESRKRDNNKKTAKCFIEKKSFIDFEVVILFASYRWTFYYASRHAAIRGAKRFCSTIGFDYEIQEDYS